MSNDEQGAHESANDPKKEELEEIWDDLAERLLAGETVENIQKEIAERGIDFSALFDVDSELDEMIADGTLAADLEDYSSNEAPFSNESLPNNKNPKKTQSMVCILIGALFAIAGILYFLQLFQPYSIPLVIPKAPIVVFVIGMVLIFLGIRLKSSAV